MEYYRPKTRGELNRKLMEGISCEVAGHVAEMTDSMLRGWMNNRHFTMYPSINQGWMVFEPLPKSKITRKSILTAAYESVKNDLKICGAIRNKYAVPQDAINRVNRWRKLVQREQAKCQRPNNKLFQSLICGEWLDSHPNVWMEYSTSQH